MSALVAHCDFETRSAADLKAVGLHNYARHPSTGVWCMSWAIGEMEPVIWVPGMDNPYPLMMHVLRGGTVVAHNAPFELEIWNVICVPRYRFAPLKPEQTECTMATAYAMGLPGALEDAALALGLHMLKDADGRALMLRMARPRRVEPTGEIVWWDEPEKVARLHEYCKQDVRVERALHERLVPLGPQERRVWLADYRINQRGVQLDVETVQGAVEAVDQLKGEYNVSMSFVTGGAVTSVSALAALKEWCAAQGHPVETLAKTDLPGIIQSLPDGPVKEALKIREESGKASLAKLDTMMAVAGLDGRLRNLYQYHGANTGRWAGRKVQPHNLTRDVPKLANDKVDIEGIERTFKWLREGNVPAIDITYGSPMSWLSRCLRPLFIAPPGKVLVGGDWSNVEGRGAMWFAGEEWKLQVFRDADEGRGPDSYRMTAGKIFKKRPEEITKNERQAGKILDLSMQYGGGVGAFKNMARAFGVVETDRVIDSWKKEWRIAHPNVVRTWKQLEVASINAVREPGTVHFAGAPGREVRFKVVGSFLWCQLPSGRVLCYPFPRILDGKYGPQLTYKTQPGAADMGRLIYDEGNSPVWARIATYGGSLLENIVQAFCRDFLAEHILWAEANDYPVVVHTHDDCYAEVAIARADEAQIEWQARMNTAPAWAQGFPLKADVDVLSRYGC